MKRWIFITFLSSVVLVGSNTESVEQLAQIYPSLDVCRESTNHTLGKCTANLRSISSHYAVKEGKVYWMTREKFNETPCGMGIASLFPNLFSWKCLRSEKNEPYEVEVRDLYRGVHYSPAFHSLEGSEPLRAKWQQGQLANYAKDEKSVYFKGELIEGADPQQFSVIFPFGEDEKWEGFHVSQSGRSVFLMDKIIDDVDLRQFRAFTPVRCPEHGLSSCTGARETDYFFKYGGWRGVLGRIGDDIVFLRPDGITQFPYRVSPDAFMFASAQRVYLYSQGEFYELTKDGKKFIEMDVGFFERYSY